MKASRLLTLACCGLITLTGCSSQRDEDKGITREKGTSQGYKVEVVQASIPGHYAKNIVLNGSDSDTEYFSICGKYTSETGSVDFVDAQRKAPPRIYVRYGKGINLPTSIFGDEGRKEFERLKLILEKAEADVSGD